MKTSDAKTSKSVWDFFLLNEHFYQALKFRFSNFTLIALKGYYSFIQYYLHRSLIKMLI